MEKYVYHCWELGMEINPKNELKHINVFTSISINSIININ